MSRWCGLRWTLLFASRIVGKQLGVVVIRNLFSILGLGGLLLFGAAPAVAQDLGGLPESEAMSSKEKLDITQEALVRMQAMVDQEVVLLRKAEEKGGPEEIQCIKDKLAASRAMLDVSTLARQAMQEALASNSTARADTEYRKISVALSKVEQFLAEALACVGEENTLGEVVSSSNGDDESGRDDFKDIATIGDIGDDPPNTTPYQ